MKKRQLLIIVMIIIAVLFTMTACGKNNEGEKTGIESDVTEISFAARELALEYCNGTWDGTFFSTDEHCASIEDGVLWIDCSPTDTIPDMGPVEDYWAEVVRVTSDGTWTYDSKLGTIELWKHGLRYQKILTRAENPYYTYVYILDNCIVIHYGSSIDILDINGYELLSFDNIIDVYQNENEILCSTFEHDNFKITADGMVVALESKTVRFERVPGEIAPSNELLLSQAFNLFYGENWNGYCRRLDDGQFMAVDDYSGDIIVNNKIIGNVCLGDSVVDNYGPNIYLGVDRSYYLDGKQLVYFEHGPIEKKVDVPVGNSKFLWIFNDYDDEGNFTSSTIAAQSGDTLYIVENDCTVRIVSEGVVDACVAYDTLYYMVEDVVYSLDWLNPESAPRVYFEGAYAVSHHTDETEGAIVPFEKSNYEGYGYSNLYSPYGKNLH